MNCNFVEIQPQKYQCNKCNFIIKTNKDIKTFLRVCTENSSTATMTLIEKANSLKQTASDFITSGAKITSDEEKNNRLEICKQCVPHYQNGTCNLCGCSMNLKTRIEKAFCPIGKW